MNKTKKAIGTLALEFILMASSVSVINGQQYNDTGYNMEIDLILDYFNIPDSTLREERDEKYNHPKIKNIYGADINIIDNIGLFNTLDDESKLKLFNIENLFLEDVIGRFLGSDNENVIEYHLRSKDSVLEKTGIHSEWIHFIDPSSDTNYMIFFYYKE